MISRRVNHVQLPARAHNSPDDVSPIHFVCSHRLPNERQVDIYKLLESTHWKPTHGVMTANDKIHSVSGIIQGVR